MHTTLELYFFFKTSFIEKNCKICLFAANTRECTIHRPWLLRDIAARGSCLNVSSLVWTCIGVISFQRVQHSSFIRLLFLSLINSWLCSYLFGALYTHTHTQKNHRWITLKYKEAFSNLRQEPGRIRQTSWEAKSSLKESLSPREGREK